jgi:hypothetical protein
VFTARYALSPYVKQIRFVFKGSIFRETPLLPIIKKWSPGLCRTREGNALVENITPVVLQVIGNHMTKLPRLKVFLHIDLSKSYRLLDALPASVHIGSKFCPQSIFVCFAQVSEQGQFPRTVIADQVYKKEVVC